MLDLAVGEIVDALHETGMWDASLVLYHSDNGGTTSGGNNYPLYGGKFTLWEGGVRTRLVLSGGVVPRARRGGQGLMHSADLLPTLAALADTRRAAWQTQTLHQQAASIVLCYYSRARLAPRCRGTTAEGHNLWEEILQDQQSSRTHIVHQPLIAAEGDAQVGDGLSYAAPFPQISGSCGGFSASFDDSACQTPDCLCSGVITARVGADGQIVGAGEPGTLYKLIVGYPGRPGHSPSHVWDQNWHAGRKDGCSAGAAMNNWCNESPWCLFDLGAEEGSECTNLADSHAALVGTLKRALEQAGSEARTMTGRARLERDYEEWPAAPARDGSSWFEHEARRQCAAFAAQASRLSRAHALPRPVVWPPTAGCGCWPPAVQGDMSCALSSAGAEPCHASHGRTSKWTRAPSARTVRPATRCPS